MYGIANIDFYNKLFKAELLVYPCTKVYSDHESDQSKVYSEERAQQTKSVECKYNFNYSKHDNKK